MGMIAAIGPNVMPRLFPANRMGFIMGLWSIWNVPGILLATIVGPMVVTSTGDIHLLWWINIALYIVALVWTLLGCKMNAENENEIAVREMEASGELEKRPQRNFVLSASVASFSFVGYAALFGMYQNFYPTFLQSCGFDMMASTLPATITCVLTAPVSIIAGILMNKFPIAKTSLVLSHLLAGVIMAFVAFMAGGQGWLALSLLMVLVSGFMPVALRTIIPRQVTDTKKMDYVLCIMAFVTNVGAFYSGPWGAMVAGMGWEQAGLYGLLPIGLVMAILCLVLVKGDKATMQG
jgi:MFS family permease